MVCERVFVVVVVAIVVESHAFIHVFKDVASWCCINEVENGIAYWCCINDVAYRCC